MIKLAADTVFGVQEIKNFPPEVTIHLDGFIEALKTVEVDETIYGLVSKDESLKIANEYGIEWL